jgi:hypothetical protein
MELTKGGQVTVLAVDKEEVNSNLLSWAIKS